MSETTDKTKKLSEDAQGLEPRGGIGFVDIIVGESGVEVPGFVPTKNEVLQLVQYWATEIIDIDFDYFLYGQSGSQEWRTSHFAHRRLSTISQLIGEEEVTKACKQAEQVFGRGEDQQAWKIFKEGTQKEKELYQQKFWEEVKGKAAYPKLLLDGVELPTVSEDESMDGS